MVERASILSFANLSACLPTPEDLIIMKAIAHRPNDYEDIRTIVDKHPNLDHWRIEYWVKSFGVALELPNLWDEKKQMIKK